MNGFIIAFRFLTHLFTWLLILLPLTILGYFLVPIALLFESNGHLPKIFRWFENIEEPNLYGDEPEQERMKAIGINPTGFLAKYIWLAIRNPINGFSAGVLGYRLSDKIIPNTISQVKIKHPSNGSQNDYPISDYYQSGYSYELVDMFDIKETRHNGVYLYTYIKRYGKSKICIWVKFGHNLWNDSPYYRPYRRWSFEFNPFKKGLFILEN